MRRLLPEQLPARLQRDGLAPVWFISGDEPMQKLEVEDQLRTFAREQGMEERIVVDARERGFQWAGLREITGNRSLFASRRLIELRLGSNKPGKEGAAVLCDYLSRLSRPSRPSRRSSDDVLLISAPALERSTRGTKWFASLRKAIEKAGGVLMDVRPVARERLAEWIQGRVRGLGRHIEPEAAGLIAQRVEGNLLAARQELETLCLLFPGGPLGAREVLQSVTDNARFDVFDLMQSACAGELGRSLRVLHGLRAGGTDPLALLGAILWEFRRLCQLGAQYEAGGDWDSLCKRLAIWGEARREALRRAAERHPAASLHRLLLYATHIERGLKSSQSQPWDQLALFLVCLAGRGELLPQ